MNRRSFFGRAVIGIAVMLGWKSASSMTAAQELYIDDAMPLPEVPMRGWKFGVLIRGVGSESITEKLAWKEMNRVLGHRTIVFGDTYYTPQKASIIEIKHAGPGDCPFVTNIFKRVVFDTIGVGCPIWTQEELERFYESERRKS